MIAVILRLRDRPSFARILPFAVYIGFMALAPMLGVSDEFDVRWLYGVRIAAVAVALSLFWRRYQEVNRGFSLPPRVLLGSLGVGIAVFVLWVNLGQSWAVIGAANGFDPRLANGGLDWALVTVRILGAATVVPLMEELFWRSLVMRWIEHSPFYSVSPAAVGWRAVVMSSAVFGVEHHLWLAGILAGLAYALLYRASGNLWASVVAHSVTNLLLGVWVVSTGSWQFW